MYKIDITSLIALYYQRNINITSNLWVKYKWYFLKYKSISYIFKNLNERKLDYDIQINYEKSDLLLIYFSINMNFNLKNLALLN